MTMTTEQERAFNIQDQLADRAVQALNLDPLKYTYVDKDYEDNDEWKPEPNKVYENHMRICIDEFFDGLTPDSDIEEALDRVAIVGPCEFRWTVGRYSRWSDEKGLKAKLISPSWRAVFNVANMAFINAGSPDHCFLESFKDKSGDGVYEFFFGS